MSFLKKCFCCFKKKITKITLIDKDESLPKSPTKSRKDSLFITSVNKDMESSNKLLKKDNERISEMNQKLNEINNQNNKSNEVDQLDILLIPQNYVRDDEADKIKFTTRGILNFIDEIRKENNDGQWINIYKKDGLVVDYKNGVFLYLISLCYLINYF
jgi:vacuolar-type H+-ATPase subunit I/STV1